MILVLAKAMMFSSISMVVGFAALGAGIMFGSYNIGFSRNPSEKDGLFSSTIMWFALIESFIFTALLLILVGIALL